VEAAGAIAPVLATRYPGVGPRAAATLVDAIVGFVVIGIPLLAMFGDRSSVTTDSGTTTRYTIDDPKILLLWCALAVVYYVLFESAIGATPGKLVLGLRVRGADGSKCTFNAAVVRNVLRIVDAFPYVLPYLVAAIAVWNDNTGVAGSSLKRRRRLGDRIAGTIVTYR
jgi:uncharacterized RDD family membrane protein YckC